MNEIRRLQKQLKVLLRIETTLRKDARRAALPYEKKAHKVHRDWVRVYKKLQRINRPKTLDDAFGETTIHGCNPCH